MKILYITYIDFNKNAKSGSSVRPKKMYEAFIDEGHEIILLQTQQNKRKERKKAVKTILKKLETETVDACYIESPSGPIFNQIDIKLIKVIKKRRIPLSLFYRDAHWLFAKSWLKTNIIKKSIIILMQKRDIKTFQRNIDQFYMPSIKACEEIEKFYIFNNIKELPPGTENNQIQDLKNTKTAIYVGASSYQYGTDLLIASYNSLWEKGYRYKLIIVTREAEWRKMYPEGLGYEWLEVHHTSGMDLKQLYEQADCAILPMRKSYYSDLSYSIKLFEYLSYGKPIISNDFEMMGAFVRKYNCGMIYNDEENGLENAIATFYKSREIREKLYKNVIEACNKNLWRERVREIIKDFKELK